MDVDFDLCAKRSALVQVPVSQSAAQRLGSAAPTRLRWQDTLEASRPWRARHVSLKRKGGHRLEPHVRRQRQLHFTTSACHARLQENRRLRLL